MKPVGMCISICGLLLSAFGATSVSFKNGLPSNWSYDSYWRDWSYYGETYVTADIATATMGDVGFLKQADSFPSEQLPNCNNIFAEIELSNIPPASMDYVDRMQLIVSTNNWQDIIDVGDPFEYYDPNSTNAWVVHKVSGTIEGISASEQFSVGLKVIAAGYSRNDYIFVKSITIDFLPGAACIDVNFLDQPKIGDVRAIVSATINPEPSDAIKDLTVWAEVSRNGNYHTNQLFAVDGEKKAYTNDVLGVTGRETIPLDAGDNISVSILTRYKTETEAAAGIFNEESGLYEELTSKVAARSNVAPFGSVWINEFDGNKVELCGTTNRYYLGGWKLVLEKEDFHSVYEFGDEPFDFNDATGDGFNKVVGVNVYDCQWNPMYSGEGEYTICLINAAGIVEHSISGIELPVAESKSYGYAGTALWHMNGFNWEGWTTNNTFSGWVMSVPTFGAANQNQYFEAEQKTWLVLNTVVSNESESGLDENFPNVNVDYSVEWSHSSYHDVAKTGDEGRSSPIELTGIHTNQNYVGVTGYCSAFGWMSDMFSDYVRLGATNIITIALQPSVAEDGFYGGQIDSYWENKGSCSFYYGTWYDDGVIRFDASTEDKGNSAELECTNPLRSAGTGCVNLDLSARNDLWYGTGYSDFAYLQLATNQDFSSEAIIATSV